MSQPPRPAQESAESPPAHTAGQTEDVAAPPRSNRWASTERRTPALEDKSKFLGCGWGWGQGMCGEGRKERAQHFRLHLQPHLLASRRLPRFHAATSARPLRDFPFPLGKARGLQGPQTPQDVLPTFLPMCWESPCLSRSTLCSACSEPGADTGPVLSWFQ